MTTSYYARVAEWRELLWPRGRYTVVAESRLTPAERAGVRRARNEIFAIYAQLKPTDPSDPVDPGYPVVLAALCEANEALVRVVCLPYRNRGIADDDLEQIARTAFLHALGAADTERGPAAFFQYMKKCMIGEIKRYFRDKVGRIHIPRPVKEVLAAKVRRALETVEASPDERPTTARLAELSGLTTDEVLTGLLALAAMDLVTSLDSPMPDRTGSGAGVTLADRIGDEDPGFERMLEFYDLEAALWILDDRELKLMNLRHRDERAQSEIAEILGISQMHVSRLLAQCHTALRIELTLDDRGFEALGPRYQQALRMRHWQKMSIKSIAEAMGVHITHVQGMLNQAYAKLAMSSSPAGKRQTRRKSTKKS